MGTYSVAHNRIGFRQRARQQCTSTLWRNGTVHPGTIRRVYVQEVTTYRLKQSLLCPSQQQPLCQKLWEIGCPQASAGIHPRVAL